MKPSVSRDDLRVNHPKGHLGCGHQTSHFQHNCITEGFIFRIFRPHLQIYFVETSFMMKIIAVEICGCDRFLCMLFGVGTPGGKTLLSEVQGYMAFIAEGTSTVTCIDYVCPLMFSGFTPPPLEAEDPLKMRCVPVSTVWPGTKKVLTGLKLKCIRLGRGDPEDQKWTEMACVTCCPRDP